MRKGCRTLRQIAGGGGIEILRQLALAIFGTGNILSDWEQSYIPYLYNGIGNAVDRLKYHGMKVTDKGMELQGLRYSKDD